MKRITIGVLIGILFLIACGQVSAEAVTVVAATQNVTATQSPTVTQTSLPTATPTASTPALAPGASVTPLPTIPTFTPTFDVSTIVTVTPAPKAECPKEDTTDSAKIFSSERSLSNTEIAEKILGLLNQGIPKSRINRELTNSLTSWGAYYEPIQEEDLTNDSIPELIAQIGNGFAIYKCNMGKYEISLVLMNDFNVDFSRIISTQDMNLDGIPEVVASISACSGTGCIGIEIYEWNGYEFQSMIRAPVYDPNTKKIIEVSNSAGIDSPKSEQIIDTNSDGTIELVLTGGSGLLTLPTWRDETDIYSWNGHAFVPTYKVFSTPEYRFQAIQDADNAIILGKYDKAIQLYEEAISIKNLEWWSVERQKYEQTVIDAKWFNEPTPSVKPPEDKTEYPRLAAYAYYRIMLLHLTQNHESDATTVYNTLQKKFTNAPYGHPYVEMATAFWEAYQSTHKMYDGCAAAIEYAVQHPEILIPLGSDYHGSQSHIYVPADVCPFR